MEYIPSPVTVKTSRSTLAVWLNLTRNRIGCWPLVIFGAATTDWTKPGLVVGTGVGVEVGVAVISCPKTSGAMLPPWGVQVGKGRQEGGTPPDAVTKLPFR
jgi:hypothetical protein